MQQQCNSASHGDKAAQKGNQERRGKQKRKQKTENTGNKKRRAVHLQHQGAPPYFRTKNIEKRKMNTSKDIKQK